MSGTSSGVARPMRYRSSQDKPPAWVHHPTVGLNVPSESSRQEAPPMIEPFTGPCRGRTAGACSSSAQWEPSDCNGIRSPFAR